MPNKDILTFDDSDGKLHLYIAAAFQGKRWAGEFIFDNAPTVDEFQCQGNFMVSATAKPLKRGEIISE